MYTIVQEDEVVAVADHGWSVSDEKQDRRAMTIMRAKPSHADSCIDTLVREMVRRILDHGV